MAISIFPKQPLAISDESPAETPQGRTKIEENLSPEEITADVYRWIKDLASPSYRERQAAFLRLWELADGGRKENGSRLIESASQSTDADVAASAKWLQVLMRLSASPSEASDLIEDLTLIRSGDTETILRLARNHRWNHLLAMLAVLTPEDRVRLWGEAEVLSGIRAVIVALAWADHEEHRIPEIVDNLWSLGESIEARRLWHTLGLNDWAKQPPIYAKTPKAIGQWEIVLEEINDRIPNAVATARKLGREDKAMSILLANGLWDQAIPPQASQPLPEKSVSAGLAAIQVARLSLLAQWSGDQDLSERWAAAIGTPGPAQEDVDAIRLALNLCGRSEEALEITKKTSPDDAYELLIRQGRIEEAMRCLGIERFDIEAIQDWLNKQTQKPSVDEAADRELIQRMAMVGSMLARLGSKDLASIVDQAAIQWASSVNGDHSIARKGDPFAKKGEQLNQIETARERWKLLFDTWKKQHRRPFALSQFKQLLREGIDDELRDAILKILYRNPQDQNDGIFKHSAALLIWFTGQRNVSNPSQAAEDLERLLTGRVPNNWPNDWHRHGFPLLGRSILNDSVAESSDDELPTQLARLALLHERTDLVKEWLSYGAETNFREWMKSFLDSPPISWSQTSDPFQYSPTSYTRLTVLSEMLLQQKDFPRAIVVLDHLSQLAPEHIDFALMKSECLKSIGEVDLANQIRLQALSVPLASSDVSRHIDRFESNQLYSEAELLIKQALRGGQNRRVESWLLALQLTLMQHAPQDASDSSPSLKKVYSKAQVKELVADGRRQLLSQLDCFPEMPFELQLRYTLTTLEMMQRDVARLAILDGDFAAADQAIRTCHAVHPDQIETTIELVPLAEEAFGSEKIDAWIELYAAPLEEHLVRWPDDTLVGNNLAWLYANVERRLDRALELSQHVADLLPEESIYLDTLAEVEFRLGHIDKAIEISSRCRSLAPLETHHRTQVHRFLKAKE